MLQKIQKLRKEYLKNVHGVTFYPYQEVISDRIIQALIENLRITSGATEEDIKKLKRHEIPIEISRQAGKTTAVVHTIDFLLIFLSEMFQRRITVGIFAPQREQAKTDFDRLKEALFRSSPLYAQTDAQKQEFKEQSNANTLVLPNGSSCYIFPVTPTSKPESKTLDLIIFEESQDLEDRIVKEQIFPMGANTNAPMVFIGTAGTKICYFYRLSQTESAIKLYFDDIAPQRRRVFNETMDATHLIYEKTVNEEIEKRGRDSDEIARPYFGKWLIGSGQFMTQEDLALITENRSPTYHDKTNPCFVGIDVAKSPDSTVVIVLRKTERKELINWIELKGENYMNQFDIIKDFISNYNVLAIAVDSTGVGDPFTDMFISGTQYQDANSGLFPVKFTAPSKDMIYRNLKISIKELLTTVPNLDTKRGEKFRQQLLDLQQEYKGQLLSVHHPDATDAHDDYPDAWALAEWAYAKYNENQAEISFIQVVDPNERNIKRDDKGKIVFDWPEVEF